MTTAHRPTFNPARANDRPAISIQVSGKSLPSHTKLKFRHQDPATSDAVQGVVAVGVKTDAPLAVDANERQRLRDELIGRERDHLMKAKGGQPGGMAPYTADREAQFSSIGDDRDSGPFPRKLDDESDVSGAESEGEGEDAGSYASSGDDDDDDDDDDTEALLRELEKIKQERAETKQLVEQRRAEEEQLRLDTIASANPLLSSAGGSSSNAADFTVKRRWDDDVIFRNQAHGVEDRPKKRFVNDLLRSDFHRKFMNKYIG